MDFEPPIWFLDVDGVLNAVVRALPYGFMEGEGTPFYSDDPDAVVPTYPIKWNPHVITRINSIHDAGLARVMWLTTWGSGANNLCKVIGINNFETASEPPAHNKGPYRWGSYLDNSHEWWKFPVVRRFYEEDPNRGYIWTDDDIGIEKAAQTWAADKNIFAISPPSHHGLSLSDCSKIEGWLEMHRRSRQRNEVWKK